VDELMVKWLREVWDRRQDVLIKERGMLGLVLSRATYQSETTDL
jgi:hypothetical protein